MRRFCSLYIGYISKVYIIINIIYCNTILYSIKYTWRLLFVLFACIPVCTYICYKCYYILYIYLYPPVKDFNSRNHFLCGSIRRGYTHNIKMKNKKTKTKNTRYCDIISKRIIIIIIWYCVTIFASCGCVKNNTISASGDLYTIYYI